MNNIYIGYKSGADYAGAEDLLEQEWSYLEKNRPGFDRNNIKAVALSGGGIRSASFCLGVMQALAANDKLKKFDYLSTVSGGGYIGGALSWLWSGLWKSPGSKSKDFGVGAKDFPFGTEGRNFQKNDDSNRHQASLLRHLRQHGKYLTPGNGITGLSFLSIILRSIVMGFISLMVLSGFMFSLLYKFTLFEEGVSGTEKLWDTGLLLISGYLVLQFLYIVLLGLLKHTANSKFSYRLRRWFEYLIPLPLTLAIIFYLFAAIHWVHVELDTYKISLELAGGSVSLGALLGAMGADSKWRKVISVIPHSLQLIFASALMIFGLLVLSDYLVSFLIKANFADDYPALVSLFSYAGLETADYYIYIMGLSSLIVSLLAWVLPINNISIHRYYRDRLMETFMPDVENIIGHAEPSQKVNKKQRDVLTEQENKRLSNSASFKDRVINSLRINYRKGMGSGEAVRANESGVFKLQDNYDGTVPYHLINTNIILVESKIAKFRGRGGDNFILSPLYSGSNATGWLKTREFCGGSITIPTAVAISGAAANPDSGVAGQGLTTNVFVSILMSIFNLRLGYWASNPDTTIQKNQGRIPSYLYPGFWEIFSRNKMNEKAKFVQLSDGGHFENLALYELFRRRARLIIVCDAGADGNYEFGDLANAIEKARVDFGVQVQLDRDQLERLTPDSIPEQDNRKYAVSKKSYLITDIEYNDGNKLPAKLIYIKTTITENISADVHGYKRTHPDFPDQTTADQFFDEVQFEAYRELGWQITQEMLNSQEGKSILK